MCKVSVKFEHYSETLRQQQKCPGENAGQPGAGPGLLLPPATVEEEEIPIPPVLHAPQTPPLRARDGVQHRPGRRRPGDGRQQQRGLQWEQRQLSGEGDHDTHIDLKSSLARRSSKSPPFLV